MSMNPYERDLSQYCIFLLKISLFYRLLAIKIEIAPKVYCCRVKDLDCAAEKACNYCGDFTAQFADISIGSVGSKKGYSTVIVRSKVGDKLLRNLDAAMELVDKEEIVRLSQFKRERAKKKLSCHRQSEITHVF